MACARVCRNASASTQDRFTAERVLIRVRHADKMLEPGPEDIDHAAEVRKG